MEKTLFYDVSDLFGDPEEVIAAAASIAEKNGISGNAVANYISYKLLTSENAFSLCAEAASGHEKAGLRATPARGHPVLSGGRYTASHRL